MTTNALLHSPEWITCPGKNSLIDQEKRLSEYKRECKKVLVELRLLLHPDRLLLNPEYEKLTDKQKQYLEDLCRKVLEIKPQELLRPSAYPGLELRSLESIQSALSEARAVLKNAGLDVNVRLIIQGDTLTEQIEWLEQSIRRLEMEIESVRAEVRALSEDPDVAEKTRILNHPEGYEEVKSTLCKKAQNYRRDADVLERRLSSLFALEDNR